MQYLVLSSVFGSFLDTTAKIALPGFTKASIYYSPEPEPEHKKPEVKDIHEHAAEPEHTAEPKHVAEHVDTKSETTPSKVVADEATYSEPATVQPDNAYASATEPASYSGAGQMLINTAVVGALFFQ